MGEHKLKCTYCGQNKTVGNFYRWPQSSEPLNQYRNAKAREPMEWCKVCVDKHGQPRPITRTPTDAKTKALLDKERKEWLERRAAKETDIQSFFYRNFDVKVGKWKPR